MQANVVQLEEGEARCAPRTNLFLSATISFDGVSAPIRLRDLSSTGAKCEGSALPVLGAPVHVTRGELDASGVVIWVGRGSCGLHFHDPLKLDQWMPKRRARGQVIVDQLVDQLRSENGDGAEPLAQSRPPSSLGDALPTRLAEELAYVCRLLESLGDDLSGEPLIVRRHFEKLQNLDISSQILGHIASILVVPRPDEAVDAIGMACLRKRLLRVSL
jgi:hypothetical protein